jgi:hypothetical protein
MMIVRRLVVSNAYADMKTSSSLKFQGQLSQCCHNLWKLKERTPQWAVNRMSQTQNITGTAGIPTAMSAKREKDYTKCKCRFRIMAGETPAVPVIRCYPITCTLYFESFKHERFVSQRASLFTLAVVYSEGNYASLTLRKRLSIIETHAGTASFH